MKTKLAFAFAACFIGSLVTKHSAFAQISGINTLPSYATLKFNDTLSLNPSASPGALYQQTTGPWAGTPTLTLNQLDSTTLDFANGNINATFAGPSYAINFSALTLTQPSVNSGNANLFVNFYVEYTMSSTLASQPTLFPTFFINGTVQPGSSSFALMNGTINYYAVDSAGVNSIVDTVTYGYYNNTPGTFSTSVSGTASNGITPNIPAGSTLGLDGSFVFNVDPASLSVTTVPEPCFGMFLGLAAAFGLLRRRQARA